jgi:hypothetical protein
MCLYTDINSYFLVNLNFCKQMKIIHRKSIYILLLKHINESYSKYQKLRYSNFRGYFQYYFINDYLQNLLKHQINDSIVFVRQESPK